MNPSPARRAVRILLADDHRLLLDSLCLLLQGDGFHVVGTAERGEQAVHLARMKAPDLVLLDVHMPGLSGLDAGRQLLADHPGIRVVLLSMHNSAALVRRVKGLGFHGYLIKNASAIELCTALRLVADGGSWFPLADDNAAAGQEPGTSLLTMREMEVLRCIAQGRSSSEMAQLLGIALRTVETHRKNINSKLGTNKVSDLVLAAQRMGLT